MSLEEQIQKEIWNGWIPVVLYLARDEISSPQGVEPYFLMAHRCGYLPIDTSIIGKHFLQQVQRGNEEIWFSPPDSNEPLKWNIPTGVLYDLYGNRGRDLPWQLTVHFNNYPENKILHCQNENIIKSHFMNSIKEASYMKRGDVELINNLTKSQQDALWEGVKQRNYETFWNIQNELYVNPEQLKMIPIRILQKNNMIQLPMKPFRVDGELITLGEVLSSMFPDVFGENGNRSLQAYVHGISFPLESPLFWLATHCSHPDNFLYVSLV